MSLFLLTKLGSRTIPLSYRSLLRVSGKDARLLMQGISSNDFLHNDSPFFFSTFMNPKGKLFSDALVNIAAPDEILLDIPKEHVNNVKKLIEFSLLRLEAKVSIESEREVYASLSQSEQRDPRFSDFSVYRHYMKGNSVNQELTSFYKSFELLNGIWSAENNIKNIHAGNTNIDLLHGASGTKGCYVGQEVYSSYIHHHKTPTRIVPFVVKTPTSSLVVSKKEVCSNWDTSSFYEKDASSLEKKPVLEGTKEVGRVLYVQPNTSIGLALCESFELPKQQWTIDSTPITVIQ